MKTLVKIMIIAAIAVIPLAFASSSEACDQCGYDECVHDMPVCIDGTTNHDWVAYNEDYYYCPICDCYVGICQVDGHKWYEEYNVKPTCYDEGWVEYKCSVCYKSYTKKLPVTVHNWGSAKWIVDPWEDFDINKYAYGYICDNCDEFMYAIVTVNKGESKQILPKKYTKKAKKIKISYNKKKVSVTKKGKVKGKKSGATAKITWRIKYKKSKHWYRYTVKVKVQ